MVTYSGRLTHICGHPSATRQAQDGERTPGDLRSTAEPRRPTKSPQTTTKNLVVVDYVSEVTPRAKFGANLCKSVNEGVLGICVIYNKKLLLINLFIRLLNIYLVALNAVNTSINYSFFYFINYMI